MRYAFSGKNWIDYGIYLLLALVVLVSGYSVVQGVLQPGGEPVAAMPGVPAAEQQDVNLETDPVYDTWLNGKAGYDQALREQVKSGKAMIVYFYAPWCPHCKNFHRNLLAHPEVAEGMKQYLKVRIYPDEDEADRELMHEFGASGFPTMYVRHSKSGEFDEVNIHGRQNGYATPQDFLKRLKKATDQ